MSVAGYDVEPYVSSSGFAHGDSAWPTDTVPPPASASVSVLLIDDDAAIRSSMPRLFVDHGYVVTTAPSGQEGARLLELRRFDLVVTDLNMPGFDGIATIAALKHIDPTIEIIVVTGYAGMETAIACMKGGAHDYVQKPIDVRQLLQVFERALAKRRLDSLVALYQGSSSLLGLHDPARVKHQAELLGARMLGASEVALVEMHEGNNNKNNEALLPAHAAPRRLLLPPVPALAREASGALPRGARQRRDHPSRRVRVRPCVGLSHGGSRRRDRCPRCTPLAR